MFFLPSSFMGVKKLEDRWMLMGVWVEEMLRWPVGKSELLLQCRPGLACKVITDDCVPSILHSDVCKGLQCNS